MEEVCMKGLKVFFTMCVLGGMIFAQSPHLYYQYVWEWPDDSDTTGVVWHSWDLYNMANPNDYLYNGFVGCFTHHEESLNAIVWFSEAGNFPGHIWDNGDTCICLGSMDSTYVYDPAGYGDNPYHRGYYWLFSDTLNWLEQPQPWHPDDTLRKMLMPVVSAFSPYDSVLVEIENPYETNRDPYGNAEYDVLGFWIVADTSAAGTPNSYDVAIGFVPVDGGPGDYTFFTYWPGDYYASGIWDVYHAYYIVARPETTTTPGVIPGFSTHYMSGNSNLIILVCTNENTALSPAELSFTITPTVMTELGYLIFSLPQRTMVHVSLHDVTGRYMRTVCNETREVGEHTIVVNTQILPNGVYFLKCNTEGHQETEKFVVAR